MIDFFRRKITLYPVISGLISCVVIAIVVLELSPIDSTNTEETQTLGSTELNQSDVSEQHQIELAAEAALKIEQLLEEHALESMEKFDAELALLLSDNEFGLLRERLLKLASDAVAGNDKSRLGYILNLLGQISIQEQDLYSAEVYLTEALDIFKYLDDEMGIAQIHLQLGRIHLKTRQMARVAGIAYDELQVGRWYLFHGIHDVAEQYINNSIEKNLSINRYGSAASAYKSLAILHSRDADVERTSEAVFKAARLYSASGKIKQAQSVLALLLNAENQQFQLTELDRDIESNYQKYQTEILQIERARDYRRLYHFYKNQGDEERAWNFRLLANDSLSQVSKRAMFHRQLGVLAILYNSNESMDRAENYFAKAKLTFDVNGLPDLSKEVEKLNRQVF